MRFLARVSIAVSVCLTHGLMGTGDALPGGAQSVRAQSTTLRVVAYNIKHGRGMDDRVDLVRIADVLRRLDADVITLQEVDDRTERTGGVDQVAVLAELLGYQGFHGPHRPYQGGFYGNAVLTRLPVVEQRTHPIPPASGSALAVHEVIVEVPLTPARDGDADAQIQAALPVSVVSVHLAGTPEERMAQARAVTAAFVPGRTTILAGDFNGRPDDPVVQSFAEGWTTERKSGDPRTYPSDMPDREIDFVIWTTGHVVEATDRDHRGSGGVGSIGVIEHVVVDEPMASDHRPILAVFEFQR